MSNRLEILVNGEHVFDDEVEEWQLPPKPDQIPAALRAQLDPNVKPAPWIKAMMLAMLGKAIADGALRDPRLAPLDVELTPCATGWTITVAIPAPAADDIEVAS